MEQHSQAEHRRIDLVETDATEPLLGCGEVGDGSHQQGESDHAVQDDREDRVPFGRLLTGGVAIGDAEVRRGRGD